MEFKGIKLSKNHEIRNSNIMHRMNGSITVSVQNKEKAQKLLNLYDSAPELLDALQDIRNWYEENHDKYLGEYTPVCFSKGLSAILKATK